MHSKTSVSYQFQIS